MTRERAEEIVDALSGHIDNREDRDIKDRLVKLLMMFTEITEDQVQKVRVTLDSVNKIVVRTADAFGINVSDIIGRERTKLLSRARHVAMLLLRERGMSYPEIARAIGGMNHTSVIDGCKSIAREIARDQRLKAIVDGLRLADA